MPNPVLSPQRWEQETETDQGQAGWAAPTTGAAGMAGGLGARTAQGGADAPIAGEATMTIGGTMLATAVLFVLLLITATIGWLQVTQTETTTIVQGVPQTSISTNFPGWVWFPVIAAVILGFVTVFRPKLARFTAPLYALGYGFAIGAISHMYNLQWNGIVLQAVGATLAVFAVMLFLYATRIIKVNKKYVVVTIAATAGIFLLYMVDVDRHPVRCRHHVLERPDATRHRHQRGDRDRGGHEPRHRLRLHRAGIQRRCPEVHGVVRRFRAHGDAHLALPGDPAAPQPPSPVTARPPGQWMCHLCTVSVRS